MKVFKFLIATILLPCIFASLEEICKGAVKIDPTIDYSFCVTSLQVVPESRRADTQGLALIAVNLVEANYTHNIAKSTELLNGKNLSAKTKQILSSCVDLYKDGIYHANESKAFIKSLSIESALSDVDAAGFNVILCVDNWEQFHERSLMSKEEDDALNITGLALGITALLK